MEPWLGISSVLDPIWAPRVVAEAIGGHHAEILTVGRVRASVVDEFHGGRGADGAWEEQTT